MRLEEPIPARRKRREPATAGEALIPRIEHFFEGGIGESRFLQAVFDFERLPEFLPQPLVLESAVGEVVMPALDVEGRKFLGFDERKALIQGLVDQEHHVIVNGVDRGHDPEDDAVGLEALSDRAQGLIDQCARRA